ncbi:MAG: GIY-YIG nuclease family protein [Candidatus Hadarchaeum sp.]|uniref:GIY-YIG nuclease family protein n=1 Tax=Candidatus Hadarchaeum sp. TaxID=2883567 RepID=UPI003D0AC2C7
MSAMAKTYYVYILRSLKDDNFYTGHTADLRKRLAQHNRGDVRSTKARRPLVLIYWEPFKTRGEAMRRERKIKSMCHEAKLKLIEEFRQPG